MSETEYREPPTAIYGAMAAVMADVGAVSKDDVNQHQRFNFRGIDAVVNAVSPALRAHHVVVVPNVERVEYDSVATSTGKPATACRVLATYTFYASDGSSIDCRVAAEAWDNGDKAAPKAMSVAFRTALLQALALPTDEPDPDAQSYERVHREQSAQRLASTPEDDPFYTAPPTQPLTDKTRGHLFALFGQKGITDDEQLPGVNAVCGTAYTSRSEIGEQDAKRVIGVLKKRPDAITQTEEAGQ